MNSAGKGRSAMPGTQSAAVSAGLGRFPGDPGFLVHGSEDWLTSELSCSFKFP